MPRSPSSFRLLIFEQATIGIVNAAVQHEFGGAGLELRQRKFREQRNRIVIQFTPTYRVKVVKQADRIVIPTPPKIARQCPEPFLRRSDKAVERARFAYHWRHLRSSVGQHANFVFGKSSRFDRLHHQNALQDAAIDEWNSQERLVGFLPGFLEILESRMISYFFNRHRPNLLRNQPGESLMDAHPKGAYAFATKTKGRSQNEI